MEVRSVRIEDDAMWDDFTQYAGDLLPLTQTSEWVRVLVSEGERLECLVVETNGKRTAQTLVTYHDTPLGTYAYSPYGPVFASSLSDGENNEAWSSLRTYISRSSFLWRVEPRTVPRGIKMQSVTMVQPATTITVPLTSPEELLARFHPKTRYNIRLAERKGVTITWEKNEELFWSISQETGNRDGFRLHPRAHYQAVLAASSAEQATAWHDGQPIASAVFWKTPATYTYLYGASRYHFRQLMAPHLVQWQALLRARAYGCALYDFFGIAEPLGPRSPKTRVLSVADYRYDERSSKAGYTRFKLGFEGDIRVFPGTYEIIFSLPRALTYRLLRLVRRVKSRFL